MKKKWLVWGLIGCMLLAAGCDKVPGPSSSDAPTSSGEESVSSSPSSGVPEPEPDPAPGWVQEDYAPPAPLSEYLVDDRNTEFAAVEASVEPLFVLSEQELSVAHVALVGRNIVANEQQEAVRVLDTAGEELASVPIRGRTAEISKRHFTVCDYEKETIFIYDENGSPVGEFSTGTIPGSVQMVRVAEDGSAAALLVDGSAYWIDLNSGEQVEITLTREGVSVGYGLSFLRDYLCIGGLQEDQECWILWDPDTREVAKVARYSENGATENEAGDPVFPLAYVTDTGLLYRVADSYSQVMQGAVLTGERMDAVFHQHGKGGVWMQYWPVTSQGRAGYLPLYNLEWVGAEDQDHAIVRYRSMGQWQFARITLSDRLVDPPASGVDLSEETLSSMVGQHLNSHGTGGSRGDTCELLSAIAANYAYYFADDGYQLAADSASVADSLYFYVLLNSYNESDVLADRLADYYREDEGIYRIPADVVIGWVKDTFRMEDFEVDMRLSSLYEKADDVFTYGPGGGIGETDSVYVESVSFQDGRLDLTVTVEPAISAAAEGRRRERVRFLAGYDPEEDRYWYEKVEVLE